MAVLGARAVQAGGRQGPSARCAHLPTPAPLGRAQIKQGSPTTLRYCLSPAACTKCTPQIRHTALNQAASPCNSVPHGFLQKKQLWVQPRPSALEQGTGGGRGSAADKRRAKRRRELRREGTVCTANTHSPHAPESKHPLQITPGKKVSAVTAEKIQSKPCTSQTALFQHPSICFIWLVTGHRRPPNDSEKRSGDA